MRKRRRAASLFFILGGILLLSAIPCSAAINRIMLERETKVRLAQDCNAVLKLTGFDNEAYDMNGSYKSFGSITNQTGQTIKLMVTVSPDYQIYHMFGRLGIKLGNEACEFSYSYCASKQLTLTIPAGQTVDAKAYLVNNFLYSLPVNFKFSAADTAGSFTLILEDTQDTPRRIYLY